MFATPGEGKVRHSRAGIVGIVCNPFLLVWPFKRRWLIGGSITIVADAVNNLSDAGSSVVTLSGLRSFAKRPADAEHPYGHARYEYITGASGFVFPFWPSAYFLPKAR